MSHLPLALTLPLYGPHWIEASAGTGKTFTLSLLALRCVLERNLTLPEILIVTFTNAATHDLKIKIRDDIAYAAYFLEHNYAQTNQSFDKKQRLFFEILQRAVNATSVETARARLLRALQDYDRASIYSIHGFCSRVIQEHALLIGEMLNEDTLLTQTAGLNQTIALSIWRELSKDSSPWAWALLNLWSSPSALARQLDVLLRAETLLPPAHIATTENFHAAELTEAHHKLRAAVETSMPDAKAWIDHAIGSTWLHKRNYSHDIAQNNYEKLAAWYAQDTVFCFDDPDIHRLSFDYIQKMAGKQKDKVPALPLFIAVQAWQQAYIAWHADINSKKSACLHHVKALAKQKREEILSARQQKTYDDLIHRVHAALHHPEIRQRLLPLLREAYPVTMVDEFQDTDTQQWQIFSTLCLSDVQHLDQNHSALYLIGDPKQAIYGFRGGDVHAYLAAKKTMTARTALIENFRSRPSLIKAVNHCFTINKNPPFIEDAIEFTPAMAGGNITDADFLINNTPAPALTITVLADHVDDGGNISKSPKELARLNAANACADQIAILLNAAANGNATLHLEHIDLPKTRVAPGHMAVLVNTHDDAKLMQMALMQRGVASVTSSKYSVFDTQEAEEIRLLLEALLDVHDIRRWRGVLSGQLFGYRNEDLIQLDDDTNALQTSTVLRARSAEQWRTLGVLALCQALCAEAAPRLLALNDGERRLSNYLQLAETLQAISKTLLGPEALYQWLCQQMLQHDVAQSDDDLLRLDSDQDRVHIMTVHKSKGLEFPLVFLPFISQHRSGIPNTELSFLHYHDENQQRVSYALHSRDKDALDQQHVKVRALTEQAAEKVRLLYVAMTRAKHYLWLCVGHIKEAELTPFSQLLQLTQAASQAEILQSLHLLSLPTHIMQIDAINMDAVNVLWQKPAENSNRILIAKPSQRIQRDWRVHSFSGLSEALPHVSSYDILTNIPLDQPGTQFAGKAFGNALHLALETISIPAWANIREPQELDDDQLHVIDRALQHHGIESDDHRARDLLSDLIRHTLQVPLPEGIRLCDISAAKRRNEMEFYFSLQQGNTPAVWELLKTHHIILNAQENRLPALTGLMTGKVDLVYEHAGLYYIADYKSNRLNAYDQAHCHNAMHQHYYYLQALIYTLALHRWCRFYLGEKYHYAKHIGGVRYLFCRGLNADASPASNTGLVAFRFEESLITALERLLHPETAGLWHE